MSFVYLLFFMTISFGSKAQTFSFEQTSEYIKNLLTQQQSQFWANDQDVCGNIEKVSIEKNGRISFECNGWSSGLKKSFNIFDVQKSVYKTDIIDSNKPMLVLTGKNNSTIGIFKKLTVQDSERLWKALWHLKTVCVNSDPFGN